MDLQVQVFLTDVPTNESTDRVRITEKKLRVKVRCTSKRWILSHVDLDLTTKNLRRQVEIAAGAIVEKHAEKYGDRADPERAAKHAGELYQRLGLGL